MTSGNLMRMLTIIYPSHNNGSKIIILTKNLNCICYIFHISTNLFIFLKATHPKQWSSYIVNESNPRQLWIQLKPISNQFLSWGRSWNAINNGTGKSHRRQGPKINFPSIQTWPSLIELHCYLPLTVSKIALSFLK